MFGTTKNWNYYKKVKLVEILYLFILFVIIPLSMGLQIFDRFSFTLSLTLVNMLQAPSIVFFYRWLLPRTLFNNRPWWFLASLPFYLLLYEINARLSYSADDQPALYSGKIPLQPGIRGALALDGKLIQNMGYTPLILLTSIGLLFIRELFKRQHMVDQLQSG